MLDKFIIGILGIIFGAGVMSVIYETKLAAMNIHFLSPNGFISPIEVKVFFTLIVGIALVATIIISKKEDQKEQDISS